MADVNDVSATSRPKVVFFDFMGTCLDWHSSIVKSFPSTLSDDEKSDVALEWRLEFFEAIKARPLGETPEDIDATHTRVLKTILSQPEKADLSSHFSTGDGQTGAIEAAVRAWHFMDAWQDVKPELERLRSELGCEIFVLANGTTRLQLDLVRSSGLQFDMLFSSELLGVAKPTPEIYQKAMKLVKVQQPSQVVMVAAHAYDLRAAKKEGIQTVYIKRWTDDQDETDADKIYEDNCGRVLDGFEGLAEMIKTMRPVNS